MACTENYIVLLMIILAKSLLSHQVAHSLDGYDETYRWRVTFLCAPQIEQKSRRLSKPWLPASSRAL